MLRDDEKRFRLADGNADEKLSVDEFAPFQHPYNYEHMAHLEVERVTEQYDTNSDGMQPC